MTRLGLLACVLAGCFSPQAPAGAPCSSAGVCPSGLACIANACVAPGTQPLDAPTPDASPDATDAMLAIDGPPLPTFTPSNGIDPRLVDPLATTIAINGAAVFDVDTGAISGAITRAPGAGIQGDIAYASVGGLGVFGFGNLTVGAGGTIGFTGARPVVLLVGGTATIIGTIDGGGGHCVGDPTCAGPGGGRGAVATATPGGCGAAHGGLTNVPDNSDSGGGGGGGGGAGAAGGASGTVYAGGIGGPACLAATLEPLVGGGGGAGGGTGATTPSRGGGGGGTLQITALMQLHVSGTIAMGGGGGEQGFLDPGATSNGGGGAGGGGGGGILLESPVLSLVASSILAANGGGGGGPGFASAADGTPGASGGANATPALGGAPGGTGNSPGGNGGAGMTAPAMVVASNPGSNAGGGGGGVGRIFLRAMIPPPLAGLQSPPAGTGTLKP